MNMGDLIPVGVTFVLVGVVIAIGLNVMADTRDEFITGAAGCNSTVVAGCGADYNASVDTISGTSELADKLPLLGLVVAAAIIIGVLIKAFRS